MKDSGSVLVEGVEDHKKNKRKKTQKSYYGTRTYVGVQNNTHLFGSIRESR